MKAKRSKLGLTIGLFFAVLLFLLSFPVSWLARYYTHLNQLSHSVKSYDRDGAQKGLEVLKEEYNHFVKWKLQYPADKFLFQDMHLYRAAASVLDEDFEKVEKNDLKDRGGWRESYILAISKFWALHAAYQEAMPKNDKAKMDQILGMVLDEVRPDFEKCVKEGPGPSENFNCSFNYDLTSDPNSARRALASPKPQIKYIVQPGGNKPDFGKGPKKKGSPKMGSGDNKDAGKGGAKKVG